MLWPMAPPTSNATITIAAMHVNRILHELRSYERVHELLHAYGEREREHGGNGAHEQTDHGRNRAANPGTHDGNQV